MLLCLCPSSLLLAWEGAGRRGHVGRGREQRQHPAHAPRTPSQEEEKWGEMRGTFQDVYWSIWCV